MVCGQCAGEQHTSFRQPKLPAATAATAVAMMPPSLAVAPEPSAVVSTRLEVPAREARDV